MNLGNKKTLLLYTLEKLCVLNSERCCLLGVKLKGSLVDNMKRLCVERPCVLD